MLSEDLAAASARKRKPTRKEKIILAELRNEKILCPVLECGKELRDVRGEEEYEFRTVFPSMYYMHCIALI